MSPTASYAFIDAREAALNLTKAVQQLLIWIQGCLVEVATCIASLVAIDLEYLLTRGRRKTLLDLVPESLLFHPENITYVIQAAPRVYMHLAPSKKVFISSERWELQKISLYGLCNLISLYSLPNISRTLVPLKK